MSEGSEALSEREKETLRLLLSGHDIKSVATSLGLSVHTVNERLREARRKLRASSSRQAARILAETEGVRPNFSADPNFSAGSESGVAAAAPSKANGERSHGSRGGGHALAWLSGGMLIMSVAIAVVVLSSVLQGGSASPLLAPTRPVSTAAAPSTAESAGAAREWLTMVDGRHWNESWNAAGALLKSHVSAAIFASKIAPTRQALGPVSSRVLQSVTKATSLPGAPDGQYEVLQFATSFAQKPQAIETVALEHDSSGWKVDGYFIK